MSTIQQRKVKTLSDQAAGRSTHRADQAVKSRPVECTSHADIDSMTHRVESSLNRSVNRSVNRNTTRSTTRNAVAGAHGTDTFLFDDLKSIGNPTAGTLIVNEPSPAKGAPKDRKHSTSKNKRRLGAHTGSAVRDRHSAKEQDLLGSEIPTGSKDLGGKGTGRKGHPSAIQSARPNVVTAELPFATCATKDDAGERKLRRRPNAGPYRAMQMARRSSLPTPQTSGNALLGSPSVCKVKSKVDQSGVAAENRVAREWNEAFRASTGPQESPIDPTSPINPTSPEQGAAQRLSQLLAKPEVGGYLVMGALIACTFLI
jgi:hypothetical protein